MDPSQPELNERPTKRRSVPPEAAANGEAATTADDIDTKTEESPAQKLQQKKKGNGERNKG